MRDQLRRLAPAVLGAAALLGGSHAPAEAACIEVDFAVHVSGQPDYYPLGPDKCVTETPWNQTDSIWNGLNQSGLPPGTPSGFWLEVWYTSP